MSLPYASATLAFCAVCLGLATAAVAAMWNAPMRPAPSPGGRMALRGLIAVGAYGGAASLVFAVVPLLGLIFPVRETGGVVSALATEHYGGKYSTNDRTLDYIVVDGKKYMTNNDGAPDPAIGDRVCFTYHEGVNAIASIVDRGPKRAAAGLEDPCAGQAGSVRFP